MKPYSSLIGALLTLSAVCYSWSAQALTVNYSGSNVNLNTVALGQNGTITNATSDIFPAPPNFDAGGQVQGFLLAPNDKIVFSYSFTGLLNGQLSADTSYDYTTGVNHFQGSATAASVPSSTTATGFTNGIASAPLVFANANLTVVPTGTSTGTVSFYNFSSGLAHFQSIFFGLLKGSPHGAGTITYAVSHIPLPASLPMFGALIAGLFGFSRYASNRGRMTSIAA